MSADLDAIAREAALAVMEDLRDRRGIKSEIRQISDAVIEEIVTDHARIARVYIEQAIAQDRKTSDEELAELAHSNQCLSSEVAALSFECGDLVDANRSLQQQLAQQSAALDSAINLVRRSQEDYQSSNSLGLWNERRDYLAQLAEAPRVEPRALTSGEAVEAAEH